MEKLIEKIEKWAEDRNLINGSLPEKQAMKFVEELGELAAGINKNNRGLMEDSIGDLFVVLIILNKILRRSNVLLIREPEVSNLLSPNIYMYRLTRDISMLLAGGINNHLSASVVGNLSDNIKLMAKTLNLSFDYCLILAWEEIKNRKGMMVNGVFIKQEDL